jgi:hypothetical protein
MKIYSLILVCENTRAICSWNTGDPRADLTAAMKRAEGYVKRGCKVRVECNGEIVWTNH